jgi:hypothetical protein
MNGVGHTSGIGSWPLRGTIGLVLVAVFWVLNWWLSGVRTHWGFFPLWLGYCLTIDAWNYRGNGTSLWTRSRGHYVGLFVISAPTWWLFELINWRTGNWIYLGRADFSDVEYVLWASLSFSTVVPAVFGTAERIGALRWVRQLPPGCGYTISALGRLCLIVAGAVMLLLALAWPRYFFPLVWLSLFLIIDPLNDILGHRSLLRSASRGDWSSFVALGLGCLVCGFFWEMWNSLSYPKWTYRIPFVDFFRIFEMPVLGYGGYVPFSMELFALYHLITGAVFPGASQSFVRLSESGQTSGVGHSV